MIYYISSIESYQLDNIDELSMLYVVLPMAEIQDRSIPAKAIIFQNINQAIQETIDSQDYVLIINETRIADDVVNTFAAFVNHSSQEQSEQIQLNNVRKKLDRYINNYALKTMVWKDGKLLFLRIVLRGI
jgi:hypothetical protein